MLVNMAVLVIVPVLPLPPLLVQGLLLLVLFAGMLKWHNVGVRIRSGCNIMPADWTVAIYRANGRTFSHCAAHEKQVDPAIKAQKKATKQEKVVEAVCRKPLLAPAAEYSLLLSHMGS